jgi:cytochrome bd-type quinol oxidase subunit 1
MVSDDVRGERPPAIVARADQVEAMRTRLRQMQAELRDRPRTDAVYDAAVDTLANATLDLLDAQAQLREMLIAHRQQLVAELLEKERAQARLRMWQLAVVVALLGTVLVVLATTGVIVRSRLVIGISLLIVAILMAVSMASWVARELGGQSVDLRKGILTALLASLAFVGALTWLPMGYACLLALALAAAPIVIATRAERRRAEQRALRGRDRG